VLALDLIEKGEATENQLTREGVHQALQSEDELFHLLFSGPTAVLRRRVGKEVYRSKIEIWAAMAIARNPGLDNGELEMHSSAYYERITIVGYAFAILGILGLFGYVKLCYVFFREGERRKAVFWGAMII